MQDQAASVLSELLLAWLAAGDAPSRVSALEAHEPGLDGALVEQVLDLALAGPGYGGDREAEAGVQLTLLNLAAAAADRLGEAGLAARARRWLAAMGGGDPAELLARAWREASGAGEWREALAAARAQAVHAAEQDRHGEALLALERALQALMRLDDGPDEAGSVLKAAMGLAERTGRPGAALGLLHQWVEHAQARGDRTVLGQAQAWLGAQLVAAGEYDEAEPVLGAALALLGEMADDETLVRVHLHALVATYAQGRAEAAGRHLEAAMALRSRIEDPEVLAELERQFGRLF